MKGELGQPPQIVSHAANQRFIQLDVGTSGKYTISDQHFGVVFGNNNAILVMDPPWVTECAAKGCYSRLDDAELVQLFRGRFSRLFQPGTDKSPPEGYLFLWTVHQKMKLAVQCLYQAGYQWIGLETWAKCSDQTGEGYGMSPARGTAEHFLVGVKNAQTMEALEQMGAEELTRRALTEDSPSRGGPALYAAHGFTAPPFNRHHSSKPEEFYTDYLPNWYRVYARGLRHHPLDFHQVKKLDVFTREIQPGFTSVGLQFNGTRLSQDHVSCQGCGENVNLAVGQAKVMYCDEPNCVRAWHTSCLSGRRHNGGHWSCPGCQSGDMKPAPLTPLVEKEDVLVNRQHMHDLVVELLRFTQNRKTGKQPVGRAKIGAGQVVSVRGPRRPWTGRIQRVNKKAQTVQVEWLKPKRGYAKEATVHVDELVFG